MVVDTSSDDILRLVPIILLLLLLLLLLAASSNCVVLASFDVAVGCSRMDLCLSGLDTFLVFFLSAEDATCSSAVAALVVASLSFLLPTIAVVSDVVVGVVVVDVKEECLSPIMC